MSHCLLILSDSGLPLYTRTSDKQSTSLPFSTSGLLSALHSSSSAQHFPISTLHTADATMHFQQQDHVVLMLASHTAQLQPHILLRMRDCLVLMLGRKALQDEKQLQRSKRRMRQCTPMMDWWMHEHQRGWDRLTGLPEWTLDGTTSMSWMSELLSEVSGLCGTRHVSVYDRERLLVPSSQYASLHPHDLLSIAAYIATLSHHASSSHTPAVPSSNHTLPPPPPAQSAASAVHDQPIYLSHSTLHKRQVDGNTAYRLLVVPLQPSSSLYTVLLCGPSPSAEQVEQSVGRLAMKYDEQLREWDQNRLVQTDAAEDVLLAGVLLWKEQCCWPVPVKQTADSEAQQQRLHAFYCTMADDVNASDGQESYLLLRDGVVLYGMRRGDSRLLVAVKANSATAAREHCEQLLLREQTRYSELQHKLAQLNI